MREAVIVVEYKAMAGLCGLCYSYVIVIVTTKYTHPLAITILLLFGCIHAKSIYIISTDKTILSRLSVHSTLCLRCITIFVRYIQYTKHHHQDSVIRKRITKQLLYMYSYLTCCFLKILLFDWVQYNTNTIEKVERVCRRNSSWI